MQSLIKRILAKKILSSLFNLLIFFIFFVVVKTIFYTMKVYETFAKKNNTYFLLSSNV